MSANMHFIIDKQSLEMIEPDLVSDSRNYLTASFEFSYDWAGFSKKLFFARSQEEEPRYLDIIDDRISAEQGFDLEEGSWYMWVVGEDADQRVVTAAKRVFVESAYRHDGEPYPYQPMTVYEGLRKDIDVLVQKIPKMEKEIDGAKEEILAVEDKIQALTELMTENSKAMQKQIDTLNNKILPENRLIAYLSYTNSGELTGGGGAVITAHRVLINSGAVVFDGTERWIEIMKEDGAPLLSGLDEFTVSYDCESQGEFMKCWAFYVSPRSGDGTASTRDYLGFAHYPQRLEVERNNATCSTGEIFSGWNHFDVVCRSHSTEVYVNGNYITGMHNEVSIRDQLGAYSIAVIGKANWGAGEYFKGRMMNFKIYDRALTAHEIAEIRKDFNGTYYLQEPVTEQRITVDGGS